MLEFLFKNNFSLTSGDCFYTNLQATCFKYQRETADVLKRIQDSFNILRAGSLPKGRLVTFAKFFIKPSIVLTHVVSLFQNHSNRKPSYTDYKKNFGALSL